MHEAQAMGYLSFMIAFTFLKFTYALFLSLQIESSFLKFGRRGNKPGEFKEPYGVAVNFAGYIYVTDFINNRVQAFDSMGKVWMSFGNKGSRDGQFLGPTGIAIDSTGIVFVSDWDNHRVQLFSPNGKFIGKFGSLGEQLYVIT